MSNAIMELIAGRQRAVQAELAVLKAFNQLLQRRLAIHVRPRIDGLDDVIRFVATVGRGDNLTVSE